MNILHKALLDSFQQSREELDQSVAEKKLALIKRGDDLDIQLRNLDTTYVTLTNNETELNNKIYYNQKLITSMRIMLI